MIIDSIKSFLVEHCPWAELRRGFFYKRPYALVINFSDSFILTDISLEEKGTNLLSFYPVSLMGRNSLHANLELSIKDPRFFKVLSTVYKWFGQYEDHSRLIYLNSLCNRSEPHTFTLNDNNVEIVESGIYYNSKRLYRPTYNLSKLRKYLYRDASKLTHIIRHCLLNSVI